MNVIAVDTSASCLFLRNEGSEPRDTTYKNDDWQVGKLVEVTVVDRSSGTGRYGVRLHDQLRSAESSASLQPGSTVLAIVTGVGDQLELRVLGPGEDPILAQALAALAARYRVDLSAAAQRQILSFAATANCADADAALRAGLYLKKLGLEVTPSALSALLIAQLAPKAPAAAASNEPSRSAPLQLTPRGAQTAHVLSQSLESAINGSNCLDSGGSAQSHFAFGDGQRHGQERPHGQEQNEAAAKALLQLQDGGALQYRYATLPLMVGGELMELDMALFQQRSPESTPSAPQRLVMSINTRFLGFVRITVQSHDSNLSVALECGNGAGVAALSAALPAIREKLQELGWKIESLRCVPTAQGGSAGSQIIDHVLMSGSLDTAV